MKTNLLRQFRKRYEYFFLKDGSLKVFDHYEMLLTTYDCLEDFMDVYTNHSIGMEASLNRLKKQKKGGKLLKYYSEKQQLKRV